MLTLKKAIRRMVPRQKRRRTSPERRLRMIAWLFLACVSVPLYVLFDRVYAQLRQETLYHYRLGAEQVVDLIDAEIVTLITREENRPFAHYGFFSVEEQKLLPAKGLTLSPLSRFPVATDFPGIIGYFQIDPEGAFSSPVLPDITEAQLNAYDIQVGAEEYAMRLGLRNQLEAVLKANRLRTVQPHSKSKEGGRKGEEEALLQTRVQAAEPPAENRRDEVVGAADALQQETALRSTYQGQKLADLNIDARLYQEQQSLPNVSDRPSGFNDTTKTRSLLRRQRNEQIDIPATQSIDAYRDYVKSNVLKKTSPDADTAPAGADTSQPQLLSFEGEIDPMQLFVLQGATLALVRKAWKAKQRYIQGFLVDGGTFIQSVIRASFHKSSIGSVSRLVVSYRGEVLERLEPAPASYWQRYRGGVDRDAGAVPGRSDSLLYTSRLASPFDDVSVHFTMQSLPLGPGAAVVHVLVFLIPAVLLLGVLGIYRLASRQIKLAEARNDFVSAVSHELKTPLTSIRMYGEMLRSGWVQDDTKRQSYYDFIFFESERLSRLVANVLHLARLTRNDSALSLQTHDASALLDLARSKVHSQVEAAGFALEVVNHLPQAEDTPWRVEAEEDAFTRIVINLVDNALKFSLKAEKKVVRLELRPSNSPKRQVIFSVRDYGPGVAPDQMKKIFQLFYRAGSELTRTTPGTGIGLALVKELARKMHAEVDLRNHRPGAEFLVKMLCS